MSFYWSFSVSSGTLLSGQLSCAPIEPGSVVISIADGINDKTITDNGDGTFGGDGSGTIDYDTGFFEMDVFLPLPVSGTDVKADYIPVEGGCVTDCAKCATHYVKLDITTAGISGSNPFTIADAWQRLFEKIERDILPIHVEIKYDESREYFLVNVGSRFDNIPGDEQALDGVNLRPLFDDTSW